ncbi:hypothetical protein PCCS19_26110 [Paenibacillus sp. CCS19]|nr:hypothetical protein PCCS19_26110 [Paenibacillus cellulosilyticus]
MCPSHTYNDDTLPDLSRLIDADKAHESILTARPTPTDANIALESTLTAHRAPTNALRFQYIPR